MSERKVGSYREEREAVARVRQLRQEHNIQRQELDDDENSTTGSAASPVVTLQPVAATYGDIMQLIGPTNYAAMVELFRGSNGLPDGIHPDVQVSFELFEAIQKRLVSTRDELEVTKKELYQRNVQLTSTQSELAKSHERNAMILKELKQSEELCLELRKYSSDASLIRQQHENAVIAYKDELATLVSRLNLAEKQVADAHYKVSDTLVQLAQKDAVISSLKRGGGGQRSHSVAYDAEEGREDSGITSAPSRQRLRSFGAADKVFQDQLKQHVSSLEKEKRSLQAEVQDVLDMHEGYRHHVESVVQAYESRFMFYEDAVASHKCHDDYAIEQQGLGDSILFAAKDAEDDLDDTTSPEEKRNKKRRDTLDRENLAMAQWLQGVSSPVDNVDQLLGVCNSSHARANSLIIPDESQFSEELGLCKHSYMMILEGALELSRLLQKLDHSMMHDVVSVVELREIWAKAQPRWCDYIRQLIAGGVKDIHEGFVTMLRKEREYAHLTNERVEAKWVKIVNEQYKLIQPTSEAECTAEAETDAIGTQCGTRFFVDRVNVAVATNARPLLENKPSQTDLTGTPSTNNLNPLEADLASRETSLSPKSLERTTSGAPSSPLGTTAQFQQVVTRYTSLHSTLVDLAKVVKKLLAVNNPKEKGVKASQSNSVAIGASNVNSWDIKDPLLYLKQLDLKASGDVVNDAMELDSMLVRTCMALLLEDPEAESRLASYTRKAELYRLEHTVEMIGKMPPGQPIDASLRADVANYSKIRSQLLDEEEHMQRFDDNALQKSVKAFLTAEKFARSLLQLSKKPSGIATVAGGGDGDEHHISNNESNGNERVTRDPRVGSQGSDKSVSAADASPRSQQPSVWGRARSSNREDSENKMGSKQQQVLAAGVSPVSEGFEELPELRDDVDMDAATDRRNATDFADEGQHDSGSGGGISVPSATPSTARRNPFKNQQEQAVEQIRNTTVQPTAAMSDLSFQNKMENAAHGADWPRSRSPQAGHVFAGRQGSGGPGQPHHTYGFGSGGLHDTIWPSAAGSKISTTPSSSVHPSSVTPPPTAPTAPTVPAQDGKGPKHQVVIQESGPPPAYVKTLGDDSNKGSTQFLVSRGQVQVEKKPTRPPLQTPARATNGDFNAVDSNIFFRSDAAKGNTGGGLGLGELVVGASSSSKAGTTGGPSRQKPVVPTRSKQGEPTGEGLSIGGKPNDGSNTDGGPMKKVRVAAKVMTAAQILREVLNQQRTMMQQPVALLPEPIASKVVHRDSSAGGIKPTTVPTAAMQQGPRQVSPSSSNNSPREGTSSAPDNAKPQQEPTRGDDVTGRPPMHNNNGRARDTISPVNTAFPSPPTTAPANGRRDSAVMLRQRAEQQNMQFIKEQGGKQFIQLGLAVGSPSPTNEGYIESPRGQRSREILQSNTTRRQSQSPMMLDRLGVLPKLTEGRKSHDDMLKDSDTLELTAKKASPPPPLVAPSIVAEKPYSSHRTTATDASPPVKTETDTTYVRLQDTPHAGTTDDEAAALQRRSTRGQEGPPQPEHRGSPTRATSPRNPQLRATASAPITAVPIGNPEHTEYRQTIHGMVPKRQTGADVVMDMMKKSREKDLANRRESAHVLELGVVANGGRRGTQGGGGGSSAPPPSSSSTQQAGVMLFGGESSSPVGSKKSKTVTALTLGLGVGIGPQGDTIAPFGGATPPLFSLIPSNDALSMDSPSNTNRRSTRTSSIASQVQQRRESSTSPRSGQPQQQQQQQQQPAPPQQRTLNTSDDVNRLLQGGNKWTAPSTARPIFEKSK